MGTIIVGTALAGAVVLVVVYLFKNRGKGCASCSSCSAGNCAKRDAGR